MAGSGNGKVEIREVALGGNLKDFLDVVDYIYLGDAKYVRTLDFDLKQRLSKKNPFFRHGDGALFAAYLNGKCVGRVSAQIDHLWNERYKEKTGFFGFFDTIEDQAVADALLERANAWLRARGMKRVLGPMSLNSNEEMGCLIEGFDTPPMIMMPHHREYQGGLIEQAGFKKTKDLFAWKYVVGPLPPRAQKAVTMIEELPEVKLRHIDKNHLEREVKLVMDIFNDGWSDLWGFVPMTEPELKKMAEDFKLLLVPELTYIVEIDGEPAAFAIAIPNLNEFIHDLGGKLSPLGMAKLLWRFKVQGGKTARLALLGIRKKFRSTKKYGALSAFMYSALSKSGAKLGIEWGELSWTLEDNTPVNLGIKLMGGNVYKKYRLYEREL
jgi:hypothetical protein